MARFAIDMLIMSLLGAAAMYPLTPPDSTDMRLANADAKVYAFMKTVAGNHKAKAMNDAINGDPPECAKNTCGHVATPTSCDALAREFNGGCANACNVEDKMTIMSMLNLTHCMEIIAPACAFPSCKAAKVPPPTSCEDLTKEFDPDTGCAKTCNVEDKMTIMSMFKLDCMEAIAPSCAFPSCKDAKVPPPTSCEDLKKEFDPDTGCAKTCEDQDKLTIMSMFNLKECAGAEFPSGQH